MTTILRLHNGKHTIIPNAIFTDNRLSIEARGTLGYLMTLGDGDTISLEKVGEVTRMRRDKTRRVFRELIVSGWVTRAVNQTKIGRWSGVSYVVADIPQDGIERGATFRPKTEKPSPANTSAA